VKKVGFDSKIPKKTVDVTFLVHQIQVQLLD